MDKEKVTITKEEYERLRDRDYFLNCLQVMGVGNWQDYDDAYELYLKGVEE